jgi:hypothetical protein
VSRRQARCRRTVFGNRSLSSKLRAATPWDIARPVFVRAAFQPRVLNVHCLQFVSAGGKFMRKDHVNGRVPPYQARNTRRREANLRQVVCEVDARTGVIPANVRHFLSLDVFSAHAAQNGMGRGQLAINGRIGSSQLSDVREKLIILLAVERCGRASKASIRRPKHPIRQIRPYCPALCAGSRQQALVFSVSHRTDAAFLQPQEFGKAESPEQDGEREQQPHG